MSDDLAMDAVRVWVDELCAELGLAPADVDIDAVLGIAGLAARTVVRPAAPVTTFLLGYAAGIAQGAGADGQGALGNAEVVIRRLAARRGSDERSSPGRAESTE